MDIRKVNNLGRLATSLLVGGSVAYLKGFEQGTYAVVAGSLAGIGAMYSATRSGKRQTNTAWSVIGLTVAVAGAGAALSQTKYARYDVPVIAAGCALLTWSRSMTENK